MQARLEASTCTVQVPKHTCEQVSEAYRQSCVMTLVFKHLMPKQFGQCIPQRYCVPQVEPHTEAAPYRGEVQGVPPQRKVLLIIKQVHLRWWRWVVEKI